MTSMAEKTIAEQSDHGSGNPGDRFLTAVRDNLNAAKGRVLRGTEWKLVRSVGSCSLTGLEPTFGGRRKTGTATAAVSRRGRPLTADDIASEIGSIVGDDRDTVPQLVGLCSTEGFTDDALDADYENRGLGKDTIIVLVAPVQHGWVVRGVKNADDDRVCGLFDPEGDTGRKRRLLDELRERRVELSGGILIDDLARDLGLEVRFVADALRQEAKGDRSIRLFEISDRTFVFRTSAQRIRRMGIFDIFGSREKGKQQNREDLELERAAMQKRRDMVYADIEKLEEREARKVAEGKEAAKAKSSAVRRVAAEVAELRKDIERHHQTAALLGKKVNIASTHIHNLTMNSLRGTGAVALPTEDELTDAAVETEEMIEETKRMSELADSLRSDQDELTASTEETEIMREFEQNDYSGVQETDAGFAAEDDFEPETVLPQQPVRWPAQPGAAEPERSAEAS